MLLPVHTLGSPILRMETEPVLQFGADLASLVDDMFETMYAARGIGLAAPQVGRRERLAVVDVDDQRLVVVNPEVIMQEGTERADESCLSIPDLYGEVPRARRVIVRALDLSGQPYELDASDLLARCLQHEIDHLHGKLFIDYLSYLKRKALLSEWERMKPDFPNNLRMLKPLAADASAPRGER